MDDKENPAVEKSADKVNEAVEDATIDVQINFDVPAALRKWPSRAKERTTSSTMRVHTYCSRALLMSASSNSRPSQRASIIYTRYTLLPSRTW